LAAIKAAHRVVISHDDSGRVCGIEW